MPRDDLTRPVGWPLTGGEAGQQAAPPVSQAWRPALTRPSLLGARLVRVGVVEGELEQDVAAVEALLGRATRLGGSRLPPLHPLLSQPLPPGHLVPFEVVTLHVCLGDLKTYERMKIVIAYI